MRTGLNAFLSTLILIGTFALPAFAGDERTEYFFGDVEFSGIDGNRMATDTMLIKKSFEPKFNRVVETFVKVNSDGEATNGIITMAVDGQHFRVTDDAHTYDGYGTLFGPAWKWTHVRASLTFKNGMKCEAENFLSNPEYVMGRKILYQADGTRMGVLDESLHKVSEECFNNIWNGLLHPKAKSEEKSTPAT